MHDSAPSKMIRRYTIFVDPFRDKHTRQPIQPLKIIAFQKEMPNTKAQITVIWHVSRKYSTYYDNYKPGLQGKSPIDEWKWNSVAGVEPGAQRIAKLPMQTPEHRDPNR